ncbi:MAG: flavodoxin domain-containing protein [Clostridia bacterium]|nr:flavodoxin domain-containing protein [Clostridia bacterium]
MRDTVVIYKSKYGSTEKYARWIAEELDADLFKSTDISVKEAIGYKTVIYGGGLYAGGIAGISFISKNFAMLKDKKLAVFTVGLGETANNSDLKEIVNKNFTSDMQKYIRVFHFRGGIDYKRLSFLHKAMMGIMKKIVEREKELTEENRQFLETYGGAVDFADKSTIEPLISFVRQEG